MLGQLRGGLGGFGSGVEPASCYQVTGLTPLVCMCPSVLGQDTEPQTAPDALVGTLHGSHHHQCMNVCVNYCKSLWTMHLLNALTCKCNVNACGYRTDPVGMDHSTGNKNLRLLQGQLIRV